LHEWPKSPNDAVRIQQELKSEINLTCGFENISLITSVDTAYNNVNNRIYAAAVTMTYPDLTDVERAVAEMEAEFPYIPALLTFREGPIILKTLSRLQKKPDLIIYAAHGIAHPRFIGMASHLGLLTDIPSIGCARKILTGRYKYPSRTRGSRSVLSVAGKEVGYVYRTKDDVKPMIISPGHKCSLEKALEIIERCLTTYRMPEPLRLAHLFAGKFKQSAARKLQPVGIKTDKGND